MLKPLDIPVYFGAYFGKDSKYIVWNFADERGAMFGDGVAQFDLVSIQIHYFAPVTHDHTLDKQNIKEKILENGWTHPIITTMYESDTKYFHIVYATEKEIANG